MSSSRPRVVASLVATVLATMLVWSPARAASPPGLTVDASQLTFPENAPAAMFGTWTQTDGDEVTLSADSGTVEKSTGDPGTWGWRPAAIDGPSTLVVTITATDVDGSTSVAFTVHVTNAPPYAWTNGPIFVPVGSASERSFLWSASDPTDSVDTTVDCGTGTVTAMGDWHIQGVHTLRCDFGSAGVTQVGVRATDDDGATSDGRMSVRATHQVVSVADGRLVIDGPAGNDQMGGAVAAPDLNGDGKADIAIGGSATSSGPVFDPAYVVVVFGRSTAGTLDLGALPAGAGFRIHGVSGEVLGRTLASAGDVNGDGKDDLLISATEGAAGKGLVYVVFGSISTADVNLTTMPAERGVRITGTDAGDYTGTSLAGIGDANGDGFDDIAVGSPGFADGDGRVDLLFGRSAFTDIDLAALPANRGIHIVGPGLDTGRSVAGGDVNGDGRGDVIIGSRFGWGSNALVIYGKTTMSDIDAATLTSSQGFEIGGGEGLGITSVAAGDMNGDGYDEVALAHFQWEDQGNWAISIIRGARTNASIPYLSTASASRLTRVLAPSDLGQEMTTLDWNGDGRSDLLIGGAFQQNNGESSGSAYLVKGATSLTNLNLNAYDPRWFRIDGDVSGAFAGDGIAAGDVTGDGIDDLLVGAPGATAWDGTTEPGRVGVFSGSKTDVKAPTVTAPAKTILIGRLLTASSPTIRISWSGSDGGSGIDHFSLSQRTDAGAWVTVASTAATQVERVLATGHDYRFRVRAVDRVGNVSAWRYGTPFHLTGYQETSSKISYRGTWLTGSSPTYAGGTTKYASAAGKRATLTFTGRQIVFAAPTGPSRGTARIYINGVYTTAISLNTATAQASHVIAKWSWSTSATRTISIQVVGTGSHPRVDIDRFIVVR